MLDQYWARVRFAAQERELYLYMQATGWRKRYVLDSGVELHLFAHMTDDPGRFHVAIQPGSDTELEVIIHASSEEHLHVGSRWRIQYTPDEILGSCQIVQLLGHWQEKAGEPAGMRGRGAGFFGI